MTGKSKMRVMAIFLSALLLLNSLEGIQAEAKTAVSPKKLVLSSKNKTLYVGQKSSIKVKKVTPSKASKKVTYHSSNKKVVFVSKKGVLKAKKAGKATITVVSR